MPFNSPKDVMRKNIAVPVKWDNRSAEEIAASHSDFLAQRADEREKRRARSQLILTLRSYAADPQHPGYERARAYLHWLYEYSKDLGLDLLHSVGVG